MISFSSFFTFSEISNFIINSLKTFSSTLLLFLVKSLSNSYGLSIPSLLKIVCIASAITIQLFFKSSLILPSLTNNLRMPFKVDLIPIIVWLIGTPIFLKTVLSVKSLCSLEIGSFADKNSNIAFAVSYTHLTLPTIYSV